MIHPADDTSPAAEAAYQRAVMARSAEDRLRMAASMWNTGKRLVESGLRAQGVTDETDLKVRTFLRMYSTDFDSVTLARIASWLRAKSESTPVA
jgi:hypothetical protein